MPYCDDLLNVRVTEAAWNAADVDDLVAQHGGKLRLQIGVARTFMMEVPADRQQFTLRDLYEDPRVEWVGVPATSPVCAAMRFQNALTGEVGNLWDNFRGGIIRRLNLFQAWEDTRGTSQKPGLPPFGHCDLTQIPSLYVNKTWTAWNTALNTGDTSTIFGSDADPASLTNHGFHTGSVAYGNKTTTGTCPYPIGVAPDIQNIVYVRMSMGTNDTSTEGAAALQWAFDHGAKIISYSSGFTIEDPVLRDVCQGIFNGGGLVVSSAGNEHNALPFYPAYYSFVLNTGGTTLGDEAWGASAQYWGRLMNTQGGSYGPTVDVASVASDIPMGWSLWQRGTSYATPAVAGVCYLISCINPQLTGSEIREILLSTVDKSHRGWWFYGFFTKPARSDGVGVGIPDAAKAITKAKTTLPEYASVVFPYLRLHSASRTDKYDGDYSGWQWAPDGIRYVLNADGTVDLFANGKVGWEITGFCSRGPITEVELWINGVREYIGPPTDPWVGLLLREEYRNSLSQLRVVARTATGEVGVRDYAVSGEADVTGMPASTLKSLTFVSPWSPMTAALTSQSGSAATLGGVRDQRATVSISYPAVPWSVVGTPTTPFYLPAAFAQSTPASAPISGGAPSDAPTITGLTPSTVTVGTPFTVSLAAPGVSVAPVVSALAPNPVTVGTPVVVSISAAGPAPTVTAVTPNPVTVGTPVTVSIAA